MPFEFISCCGSPVPIAPQDRKRKDTTVVKRLTTHTHATPNQPTFHNPFDSSIPQKPLCGTHKTPLLVWDTQTYHTPSANLQPALLSNNKKYLEIYYLKGLASASTPRRG